MPITPAQRAVRAIDNRARADRGSAAARVRTHLGADADLDEPCDRLVDVGRVTLNFHPDRRRPDGVVVAAGLDADGRYRSQWATGLSNGGRNAMPGGWRHDWERALFGSAYDDADPGRTDFPVYGSLDLLSAPHGGSPAFGSCFVVLADHVVDRTTLCVGDSHRDPTDVGTATQCWSILAGLVEQAARGRLLDRRLGLDDLAHLLRTGSVDGPVGRTLTGYVEAQVHGGVSLATDVVAIVVDPSFRGTPEHDHLRRAADRFGFGLDWTPGSELDAGDVGPDFRGPTMPGRAARLADEACTLDARRIGLLASTITPGPPRVEGDPPDSDLQQVKYLWQTVFAHGHDRT